MLKVLQRDGRQLCVVEPALLKDPEAEPYVEMRRTGVVVFLLGTKLQLEMLELSENQWG